MLLLIVILWLFIDALSAVVVDVTNVIFGVDSAAVAVNVVFDVAANVVTFAAANGIVAIVVNSFLVDANLMISCFLFCYCWEMVVIAIDVVRYGSDAAITIKI